MKNANIRNKAFVFVLIFMVMVIFLPGCTKKPAEDTMDPATVEPPPMEEITPSLVIPDKEIYPGDYLFFFLRDTYVEDEIILQSDLISNNTTLQYYKSGRIALIGVNYRTKPGDYPVKIEIKRTDAKTWQLEETIIVKPKSFSKQNLKVTAQVAAIRDPKLSEDDKVHVDKAKSRSASWPMWEGPFIKPVEGRISTEFGLIRYINGKESGRHAGIDIAAPRGTPLKAANCGIITLAKGLNVTGNTIIIDHGLKLFSAYSHLDEILVKEGQAVKKGDTIGKVGSTGFSTGPHVHWTVTINDVFVSPWLFIEKDPLETIVFE